MKTSMYASNSGHWSGHYLGEGGVLRRDSKRFYTSLRRSSALSHEVLSASMAYASTIFSAINTPYGVLPWRRGYWRQELAYVLATVRRFETERILPMEKEVLVACCMFLATRNNEDQRWFWEKEAINLARQVLEDDRACDTTKLLIHSRMSLMSFLSVDDREDSREKVLSQLSWIQRNPEERISYLGQGWKTFVRLARLTFDWDAMWFGLRRDYSLDLHVKSYLWRLRAVWKRS